MNITRDEAKGCVGAGWGTLIDAIYERLSPDTFITQVKEKWGGLRFYVDSETADVLDFIDEIEKRSFEVCEMCGETGSPGYYNGWIKTLCNKHAGEVQCQNQP